MNPTQPVWDLQNDAEIFRKLQAAEQEAELSQERFSSRDVLNAIKEITCQL